MLQVVGEDYFSDLDMVSISCQFTGCTYRAENASEQVALAMYNSHQLTHQQSSSMRPSSKKPPSIPRPEIKQDVNEEDWESVVSEWGNFKRYNDIPDDQIAIQLLACCDKGLSRLVVREDPDVVTKPEAEVLEAIKRLAVIKVATCVRRTNLLHSRQASGESIREFYANVKRFCYM